jgi:hypothetical protein
MKHLLEFCNTDVQRKKIELYIKYGNMRKAGEELGVSHQNISKTIKTIQKRAAVKGIAPEADLNHVAPQGFNVKGTSTLYDEDGQVKIQWVKTQQDGLDPEEVANVFNEMLADFSAAPVSPPKEVEADLLAVYPIGDPHIGMLAHREEAGEDFDLKIATRDLQKATKMLVERSPNTDEAVVLGLGDFYHSDNPQNRTERGGNALDVDGRWHKVLKVGINLMIELVMSALAKHKHVTVKNICGNHDSNSAHFLGIAMEAYFRNEPRVTIDTSPSKFWYFEFGKILIGSTHGDTAKPEKLPGIMAADQPERWGKANFRYWYTGHIHNKQAMEFPGVLWESFRTLAAKDAWHSSMGYRSSRDMSCIIHHKEYGEIGRNTASLQLIRSQ